MAKAQKWDPGALQYGWSTGDSIRRLSRDVRGVRSWTVECQAMRGAFLLWEAKGAEGRHLCVVSRREGGSGLTRVMESLAESTPSQAGVLRAS